MRKSNSRLGIPRFCCQYTILKGEVYGKNLPPPKREVRRKSWYDDGSSWWEKGFVLWRLVNLYNHVVQIINRY